MNTNIITTTMVALCLGLAPGAEQATRGTDITADFANPPLKYGRRLRSTIESFSTSSSVLVCRNGQFEGT